MSRARIGIVYLPVIMARLGSGANALLISYLAPGTEVAVGLVIATYPFLEAISAFWAGHMADALGRRATLVVGYVMRALLMFLMYLALELHLGPLIVAVINGLMGVGAALILVSTLAMITDLTERSNRGVGMGIFEMFNLVGFAVGYFVGSLLLQVTNGPLAYVALATATLILYLIVHLYIKETIPTREGPISINPLRGIPPHVLITIPIWASLTIIVGLAIYAGRVIGLGDNGAGPLRVGLLFMGGILVLGLGATFFGKLSDKIGRGRTMAIGMAGVTSALTVLYTALSLGVDPTLAIAAASPLFLMASAIGPSILALVGDEAHLTMRGSAMGLYSVVLGMGMGIGSSLGSLAFVSLGLEGIALVAFVAFTTSIAIYLVGRFIVLKSSLATQGPREWGKRN